jgi:hypothetical protein
MKNTLFAKHSDDEKKSKLARVIKTKTHLCDEDIVNAVGQIDISKQYSIKVVDKDKFSTESTSSERIIKKISDWEEKVIRTCKILVANDSGGVCLCEEALIGSLDLKKSEKTYSLIVY